MTKLRLTYNNLESITKSQKQIVHSQLVKQLEGFKDCGDDIQIVKSSNITKNSFNLNLKVTQGIY